MINMENISNDKLIHISLFYFFYLNALQNIHLNDN